MSQDNVQRIKERLDIVDIIGSKVQLRRAGRSMKGLCPFHQEKTPSFVVYPESQNYHCFGCKKSGDIFSFVMDTENLTFPDTLKLLADRAGIELSQRHPANPKRDERRNRLIELNERAGDFFRSTLWDTVAGEAARAIVQDRQLDQPTAERFGIGYAPDSWDALKNHLQRQSNASDDQLVDAGLCSRADSGRVYDRFRNRLMFPIRDRRGRTIGFGARSLGDEMPKYLNSPQTQIFDKSATLYGLDMAFEAIRKTRTLVVVEGYMDAIAAHQFDFPNTVASMGTALTEGQVMAIRSYVDKVYIALDSDTAGQLATVRAIDTLRESFASNDQYAVDHRGLIRTGQSLDAEIRIVSLLQGKDPDDLIRADPKLWETALDGAVPLVEFVLTNRLTTIDDSPAARADALRDIAAPVLREIRDPIVRSEYVDMTARLLGYRESVVQQAVRGSRRRPVRQAEPEPRASGVVRSPEQTVLSLLLAYPLSYAQRSGTLDDLHPEIFDDGRNRAVIERLIVAGFEVEQMLSDTDDELSRYALELRNLVTVREDLSPGMANNELLQSIRQLKRARYDALVRRTRQEIADAKESGDSEQLRVSLMQMAELARDKSNYNPDISPYFNDIRTQAS